MNLTYYSRSTDNPSLNQKHGCRRGYFRGPGGSKCQPPTPASPSTRIGSCVDSFGCSGPGECRYTNDSSMDTITCSGPDAPYCSSILLQLPNNLQPVTCVSCASVPNPVPEPTRPLATLAPTSLAAPVGQVTVTQTITTTVSQPLPTTSLDGSESSQISAQATEMTVNAVPTSSESSTSPEISTQASEITINAIPTGVETSTTTEFSAQQTDIATSVPTDIDISTTAEFSAQQTEIPTSIPTSIESSATSQVSAEPTESLTVAALPTDTETSTASQPTDIPTSTEAPIVSSTLSQQTELPSTTFNAIMPVATTEEALTTISFSSAVSESILPTSTSDTTQGSETTISSTPISTITSTSTLISTSTLASTTSNSTSTATPTPLTGIPSGGGAQTNTPAIVGGIFGAIALALGFWFLVICISIKRKKKQRRRSSIPEVAQVKSVGVQTDSAGWPLRGDLEQQQNGLQQHPPQPFALFTAYQAPQQEEYPQQQQEYGQQQQQQYQPYRREQQTQIQPQQQPEVSQENLTTITEDIISEPCRTGTDVRNSREHFPPSPESIPQIEPVRPVSELGLPSGDYWTSK
ncbi:hypothetical protein QBC38DRAFT_488043 [Podospora fimiseda]|uniref:Uncharacterized protein n=1 Tax=Podospora fimiseda TaxID=252190 RepID=A0AAN7BH30_9PEZI|nr:hypothetical protein QBC38DRAFT_488043 [Podospora fimiseda]